MVAPPSDKSASAIVACTAGLSKTACTVLSCVMEAQESGRPLRCTAQGLAAELHCSRRTVDRAVLELREAGLLTVERVGRDQGKRLVCELRGPAVSA